jgi:hypothetical protein
MMPRTVVALLLVITASLVVVSQPTRAAAQTETADGAASRAAETIKPKSQLAGRDAQPATRGWYGRTIAWVQRQQQRLNRTPAERSSSERIGQWIEATATIGGASLVLGLGALFFLPASLGPAPPL